MIAVGSSFVFNGYSDRATDSRWILAKGEPVRVLALEGDYGARVCGLGASDRPAPHRTEWVWLEELTSLTDVPGALPGKVSRRQVTDILADPDSLAFTELRDRAAYMYLTRCYPTHLRPFYTGALTEMRRYANLGPQSPGFSLEPAFIHELDLDEHPMVVRAREMMARGWRLCDPIRESARHSFQKIHLSKGTQKITIRIAGEIVLGWQVPKRRR